LPKITARFFEPMLLLRTEGLPEGANWLYEIKLDGYRALAIKSGGKIHLRSRNDNDFASRYPGVVKALAALPDETVIDGEVVALDETGKASFNALQNYGSAKAAVFYYVFDVLMLEGRNVMGAPLTVRRVLLENEVLPRLSDPIKYSSELHARLTDLIPAAKEQGVEGLIAKRRDSRYEPGERSGAWQKMRLNQGQEFVIGGYTPSPRNFDALIIGYYEGAELLYAARTRNGFSPASRAGLFRKVKPLEVKECPFSNLPEKKAGRWGAGLTAAKMVECRWLKPVLVGQFEFAEWTPDNHLRHSRFVGLRDDKEARSIIRHE
jgi:bifunctional non-homologous end joining protein LigD